MYLKKSTQHAVRKQLYVSLLRFHMTYCYQSAISYNLLLSFWVVTQKDDIWRCSLWPKYDSDTISPPATHKCVC